MAATKPPSKEESSNVHHQKCNPNKFATLSARILSLGNDLNDAIAAHNTMIAKKGCHSETLPVLPISPHVANEMMTITHQGRKNCNKKDAISITRKTICYFEIVK